jgi:enoyl-CoA hydratase/carnithine racemase
MTAAPALLVERGDTAWTLTLNRPAVGNACSAELVQALDAALEAAENERAPALVLRGAGRHFCTGFDLSGLEHENDDTLLARFVRIELVLQRLARLPCPTLAVAHGRTVGAGADLFAACQVRLAQPGTTFAFKGARGFGLVLGTRRLAAHVGPGTALDWVESGRELTAEQALAHGLATTLGTTEQATALAHELPATGEPWLARALRQAVAPQAEAQDAQDLALLARSAARPGLHQRMLAYRAQVGRARPRSAEATPGAASHP